MRSYHRKTLIKKESWPLVDGWYWCPPSVIAMRVANEKKRLAKLIVTGYSHSFAFQRWSDDQTKLEARLAHACHDGRIRAASGWGVEYFRTVGGTVRIYGKCRFCDEPLSDGIKAIILMEREL